MGIANSNVNIVSPSIRSFVVVSLFRYFNLQVAHFAHQMSNMVHSLFVLCYNMLLFFYTRVAIESLCTPESVFYCINTKFGVRDRQAPSVCFFVCVSCFYLIFVHDLCLHNFSVLFYTSSSSSFAFFFNWIQYYRLTV